MRGQILYIRVRAINWQAGHFDRRGFGGGEGGGEEKEKEKEKEEGEERKLRFDVEDAVHFVAGKLN